MRKTEIKDQNVHKLRILIGSPNYSNLEPQGLYSPGNGVTNLPTLQPRELLGSLTWSQPEQKENRKGKKIL